MEEYEKYQYKLKIVGFCKLMFAVVVVFGISMYVMEQRKLTDQMTNSRFEKLSSIQADLQNSFK
jgi:hypothetical protein